jgi:hypothetical protein
MRVELLTNDIIIATGYSPACVEAVVAAVAQALGYQNSRALEDALREREMRVRRRVTSRAVR